MNSENNEVIDLTDSFTVIDQLADIVIDLDESVYVMRPDESYVLPPDSPPPERRTTLRKPKNKTTVKYTKRSSSHSTQTDNTKISSSHSTQTDKSKSSKNIGDCPICWDELGKNPLASTNCGHVFCLHCIQQVVENNKSCPTCRCSLKDASAFHPIYLQLF